MLKTFFLVQFVVREYLLVGELGPPWNEGDVVDAAV
jgi:hypothetical protein